MPRSTKPPRPTKRRRVTPPEPSEKPHYIKEWREHRGLNRRELAALIHMSPSTIGRLEAYENDYHGETLRKVSKALDVPIPQLLARDPRETNSPWEAKAIFALIAGDLRPLALDLLRTMAENAAKSTGNTSPNDGPIQALKQALHF